MRRSAGAVFNALDISGFKEAGRGGLRSKSGCNQAGARQGNTLTFSQVAGASAFDLVVDLAPAGAYTLAC